MKLKYRSIPRPVAQPSLVKLHFTSHDAEIVRAPPTAVRTNTPKVFFRYTEKNAINGTTDSGVIGVAPCRHFRRGR